jgi:hypothetical protein
MSLDSEGADPSGASVYFIRTPERRRPATCGHLRSTGQCGSRRFATDGSQAHSAFSSRPWQANRRPGFSRRLVTVPGVTSAFSSVHQTPGLSGNDRRGGPYSRSRLEVRRFRVEDPAALLQGISRQLEWARAAGRSSDCRGRSSRS